MPETATRRTGVIVVGAGIAGLGLAMQLRRSGRNDFVVLEATGDVGGVWRDNTYPGVACDIPSQLYSYSFRPEHPWTRVFAGGAEILDYLRRSADDEGVLAHVQLNSPMLAAAWAEDRWQVQTPAGTWEAPVLVLAAGRLNQPTLPAVPGLDTFPGRAFHSARWDQRSLEGLRVGVVGTGASAVQLLPHVAEQADHTVVFQRTPAWVLPRGDRAFTADEPRPTRSALAAEAEQLFEARVFGSGAATDLRARAMGHLSAQVSDPALQTELTPSYEIGCKRATFSDDFYPALQRDDVTLESSALVRVEGRTAVAGSGRSHDLDVLVFATGFETTRQPYAPLISGQGGTTLAEHWSGGMTSHASTVVAGFPNLFVLDGPNATLGHHSAVEVIESQIDYVLGALSHLNSTPGVLEVSAEAEAAYTELIDTLAERTVWLQGGCRSWYVDPRSGRLTLLWPERASEFRRRNGSFSPDPFQTKTAWEGVR